ncbi:uncharacterized protein LOC130048037 [Ostrea edulis]|uniref:uncharacterized protein LOC130048037 n=1 Tax=Ostrea edulis TaxID=37623 RepID=UPI0024AF94AB|nr:uncharacterized protein LOC130048037 [Ostrea edulis]
MPQRYCCICSNHANKYVDGKKITMHRFPSNDKVRKVWIKRCHMIRSDFNFKNYDQTRLCSEHFVGKCGPTKEHPIPTLFPTRIFKLSRMDASESTSDASDQNKEESMDTSTEMESVQTADTSLHTTGASEYTSLDMHDYFGSEFTTVTSDFVHVNKCTQTVFAVSQDQSVQTNKMSTELKNNFCQTDSNKCDFLCQASKPDIVFEDIQESDEKIMFYTGIPNKGTFNLLFNEIVVPYHRTQTDTVKNCGGRPRCLRIIDEFLLVLMRLRLGLLIEDLSDRFHISRSTCATIINTWIDFLSVNLSFLISWPDKETNDRTMPVDFQMKYPNCRAIIDCTEFFTETPQSLSNKSLMFSHYKSHSTWKALLAINPRGVITFVSDLWGGSISDKQLFKKCGILDYLEAGDQIMVDKGFLISDLTTPKGVEIIIPPFKRNGRFSRREVEETRRIANLRIHVERANERVKNFRILQGTMPITLSKVASKTFKICVALSNLQPPLVLR